MPTVRARYPDPSPDPSLSHVESKVVRHRRSPAQAPSWSGLSHQAPAGMAPSRRGLPAPEDARGPRHLGAARLGQSASRGRMNAARPCRACFRHGVRLVRGSTSSRARCQRDSLEVNGAWRPLVRVRLGWGLVRYYGYTYYGYTYYGRTDASRLPATGQRAGRSRMGVVRAASVSLLASRPPRRG